MCYGRQMVEQAGAAPGDAETNVTAARAQFVSSLGRRLEALRLALATVEQNPRSAAQRDHLRRRIHAFGAAAGVLGFDRVFEAFREAEGALGRTALADDADLAFVARTLDLVPSLVLGADVSVARGRASSSASLERRSGSWPTSVLVFAAAPLAESLLQATSGESPATLEVERTEDPERAEQIVRIMAPDVAVVDADRRGARELMETLVYDPLLDPVRIIAIGSFDRPEAAATLVALGVARVLPKPVSPDTLKRSVVEVSRERLTSTPVSEPMGDQTIETLTERLAQEIRRGLVDAVKMPSRGLTVSFGEGTDVLAAVWASVARVRELVTIRSGGVVRFDATGPEGAVPLAPWMGDGEQRQLAPGERRGREDVSLSGRTIVVADDDPAVAWFLSGLFRAAGAEAFEAHDGTRALELVREKWPDLVVSDILMPGLDGFSLCREIKRDIVLADTPVILLSWKEDLLQRVRELGVEADGYLRKEAKASVVVQRVREVLLPRARVETRMSSNGEARGRLDGLTPRLVLELATKRVGNARATIRDAGFLYEAHIRGGRLRSVTRTALDGRAERGERALSALLGVRAGRFAIQPDASECPADWSADLREVLGPTIERARAAYRALADLGRVGRVDIDVNAFEPYAVATPEPAREIVRRLAEGTSPESLIASGIASRLVESILGDVVRHGAVRRIIARDGSELFPKGSVETDAHGRTPGLKVASTRGDVPALRAVPSPRPVAAPPRPEPAAPAEPGSVPITPPVIVGDQLRKLPLPASREPAAQPPASPVEASAAPPAATVVRAPVLPTPAPALSATLASASHEAEARGAEVEPKAEDKKALKDLFDAEQAFASLLSDSIVPPPPPSDPGAFEAVRPLSGKNLAPPTSAPPEPSPLEAALRALPARIIGPDQSSTVQAPPSSRRGAPEASLPSTRTEGISGAGTLVSRPNEPSTREPEKKNVPRPEKKAEPLETPAIDMATVVATEIAETPAPPRRAPETPAPAKGVPGASAAKDAHEAPASPKGTPETLASAKAVTEASALAKGVPEAPALAGDAGVRKGEPADSARSSRTRAGASTGPTPRPVKSAPSPSKSEAKAGAASAATSGGIGLLRVVAVLIAAGGGFALMTALRHGLGPPEAPQPVVAQPSPSSMVVPAEKAVPAVPEATLEALQGSASASASSTLPDPNSRGFWPVQDIELPNDVTVLPDRGLLEIDVAAPHSIYVDGVFIGRGPTRRIPLREGPHEIRVRGDGVDAVQVVDVRKGRRVRLGTTNAQ